MMKTKIFRQYIIIVVFLSIAIALTIHFPMIMDMLFDVERRIGEGTNGSHHHVGLTQWLVHLLAETIITFIVAFVMFLMNYYILKPSDKSINNRIIRTGVAIVLTMVLASLLNRYLFMVSNIFDIGLLGGRRRNEFDITNFYVSALVVGCVLIIRLVYQKQNIKLEYEELKREALQHQYESLKNQLSPHFLFNSLTALKVLVREAPDKAQNYINSLSKALRYTLQSNEKQLVTLREEMDFMESYLFLIKIRFDTNLLVNISTADNLSSYRLPPLTIQTLVENAIKHNEISKRKPLTIEIVTTRKESLYVRNNLQKKITPEDGTGLGLSNLSKQFLMMIEKDISIIKDDQFFTVEIPLVKP
jgi:sensor histidine kinase YesM